MFKLTAIPEIVQNTEIVIPSLKEELEGFTQIIFPKPKPKPMPLSTKTRFVSLKEKINLKNANKREYLTISMKIVSLFLLNLFVLSILMVVSLPSVLFILFSAIFLTILSIILLDKILPQLNL